MASSGKDPGGSEQIAFGAPTSGIEPAAYQSDPHQVSSLFSPCYAAYTSGARLAELYNVLWYV
jgi:hypothetical protein